MASCGVEAAAPAAATGNTTTAIHACANTGADTEAGARDAAVVTAFAVERGERRDGGFLACGEKGDNLVLVGRGKAR